MKQAGLQQDAARTAPSSAVLEVPPADPAAAERHFLARLCVETDPYDLRLDLDRGGSGVAVIDARAAEAYVQCRIPGARSIPHRAIDGEATSHLPRDVVYVTYGWGPGCNAGTKAAAKLAALGFRVKELIGGLEYWRREGHPVEGTLGGEVPYYG